MKRVTAKTATVLRGVVAQYHSTTANVKGAPRLQSAGASSAADVLDTYARTIAASGVLEAKVAFAAAIRRASAALQASGVDFAKAIATVEASIRQSTQSTSNEGGSWGHLSASEHANKLLLMAAEIQPVARSISAIIVTARDDAPRALANLEQLFERLSPELDARPQQVLELLLSAASTIYGELDTHDQQRLNRHVIALYDRAPQAFSRSAPAIEMYVEALIRSGDHERLSALPSIDNASPRLAALTAATTFELSPMARRPELLERTTRDFVADPTDVVVGLEAFGMARKLGDVQRAGRLAQVLLVECRRAYSAGEGQLAHREIEPVVAAYLEQPSMLAKVSTKELDTFDTFARERVIEHVQRFGIGKRVQVERDDAATSAQISLAAVSAHPARGGRLQCGNYAFGGIAHDSRFDLPSRRAFAAYLEGRGVLDTAAPLDFCRQADLLIRNRFNTEQMEDLQSPFHHLFDSIYSELRDLLAPTSTFSATSSIADFLEGFGDCRQHAAVKFEMFQVWKEHQRRGIMSDFATRCIAGEVETLGAEEAARLAALDAWQMRIIDSRFEPLGEANSAEEHTWTLLEQTQPVPFGEPRGPSKQLRAGDSFYHQKYPLGSDLAIELTMVRHDELPSAVRERLPAGRYDARSVFLRPSNGEKCRLDSGQVCSWVTSPMPFSGDRPGSFEPRVAQPLLRGAGIGQNEVPQSLIQSYRGAVARESSPEQKTRRSASVGNALRHGNNDRVRDGGVDLFLNTIIERFPLEIIFLSQGVDSTPTRDLASSRWTSGQALLGEAQVRKTLRNIFLAGRLLQHDYAAFTRDQKPVTSGGLSQTTFGQLMQRIDGYVRDAGKHLPSEFRREDVGDVILDQLATLAMLRDLAKSDKLRAGIADSLPAGDLRRARMSTIPEDAMAVALDGNNGVLNARLIATGLFDKYLDLPARQRKTLLAAMRLPNVGQLGQPIEAFPSMLKAVAELRATQPDIAGEAVALWLFESFCRVAGVVPSQDYRNGSEVANEAYVATFLRLCETIDAIEATTSEAGCAALLDRYVYGDETSTAKLGLLTRKMAITLGQRDPAFATAFDDALQRTSSVAERAATTELFANNDLTRRDILPRQLPQLIRNLAGKDASAERLAVAAALGVRLALPFLQQAAKVADGCETQPYQVDLIELAQLCAKGMPADTEAFLSEARASYLLRDFGGRHGVVRVASASA